MFMHAVHIDRGEARPSTSGDVDGGVDGDAEGGVTGHSTGVWGRAAAAAAGPVDGRSLAVLRIALGLVATAAAVRTWSYGWADSLYATPRHRFTYFAMGWVPQPGPGAVRMLLVAVAASGLALALGWRTRWSALALAITFGWVEMIDATTYLNHYWLLTLLAVLAVAAPMGARWSLDARRLGPADVARGWIWLFRFQVGVVYSFAGLAKLQHDWLVDALPLRLWLPARGHLPLIGPLLREPITAHVLSIAGAIYDTTIVAALLWRRTRPFAWLVVVGFHVATWVLFPIGVFPWVMIAASTVFFEPDWPGRAAALLPRWVAPAPTILAPRTILPGRAPARRRLLAMAAGAWILVQLALPLRHLAYPGDHRWTAQGYRFGWNVMLVERTGSTTFLVTEPSTGRTWTADPEELYTPAQIRVMNGEPDLILQAAHEIAADERGRGHDVEVRVDAWLSFNGRPAQRWIDPDVDLAAEPRTLAPADWILSPGSSDAAHDAAYDSPDDTVVDR